MKKLQIQPLNPAKSGKKDSFSAEKSAKNIITDLKTGVRDHTRVNIFVDGRFFCSIFIEQFQELDLKIGQSLNNIELEKLKNLGNFSKLYQRALEWALMRPRTGEEAREYLRKKQYQREFEWKKYDEFSEKYQNDAEFKAKVDAERQKVRELNEKARKADFAKNNTFEYVKHYKSYYPYRPAPEISNDDIEKVLVKLDAKGLLDDEKFAEIYVATRKLASGISRRKLRTELAGKGVSFEIIEKALATSDRSDADELQKIISAKRRRYPDDEKMLAYLARQGFSWQEAKAGLEKYRSEQGDESSEK